jgi:glycosyltransferase involved in cell wall biosynthesis
MRIGVDAGSLAHPGTGIARYLAQVLAHARTETGARHEWRLYGRGPAPLPVDGTMRWHGDALPAAAGAVLALATVLPLRAARDRLDLFWGPAHRLPLVLPHRTARVVTIHDLCWRHAPGTMRLATRTLDRLLMPRALAAADRVIAVSNATRNDLLDAFPALRERVVVVAEAGGGLPPPGSLGLLAARGLSRPFVLCVGTIEPRKNLERLMLGFARLPASLRESHDLVLAGGLGWRTEAPAALAARAGIADRVRHLGRVDDALLATLYRHAACVAMPSLYEGFGLPILEALEQGTPVLVGDNSSMPELAGPAGLAVDAQDIDAIARGLSALLGDAELRARLARAAPAQAARYSWQRAARETLEVFEQAFAERRAAQRGG